MEATLDFLNNNNNNAFHNRKDVTRLKSSLTLDVDCGRSTGNGLDLSFSGRLEDGVLSTPDVGLLKLATPELERLVLHQYLQQQQQDQTAARRPEPLSHSIDGRSLFPVVAADEVGTSTAVEVRRSADQHFSAAEAHSSASRHGRHIVGSLSEFDARSAVDTFAATSSSSSSAVCSSAVQQQQQQQQQCHVIDAPVNSWNRDFYTLTSLSSSSSSMFPQLSDRAKFTQYAPLMVPQFSPSSSAAAASPTPPLPNPGQQQQQRKKTVAKGGDRFAISTPASTCSEFSIDDYEWQPSASKRACYRKFENDEDDSVSSVSGHVTTTSTGVETPPISPIDMAEQERIKLERKRARNRQAATRCRNRKLERIATLQDLADRLRATNSQLAAEVGQLRNTVYQLRRDVARHSSAGCQPLGAASHMPATFPVLHHQQQQFLQLQQPSFVLSSATGADGECFGSVL